MSLPDGPRVILRAVFGLNEGTRYRRTVDGYLLNQQGIQQRSCVLSERAFDDCGQVFLPAIGRAENQLA